MRAAERAAALVACAGLAALWLAERRARRAADARVAREAGLRESERRARTRAQREEREARLGAASPEQHLIVSKSVLLTP